MKRLIFTCCLSIGLFTLLLNAQVDLSIHFQDKLQAAGIEFLEPLENSYKDIRVPRRNFTDYDFAIRSRKEKIEIRYRIDPLEAENPVAYAPHVRTVRTLLHLATNDTNFYMSGIPVRESDLIETFNADWGKIFFFTPKEAFSPRKECKMLALFREGRGMAYVFFLFDEPSPELDYRFYALRFLNGATETVTPPEN